MARTTRDPKAAADQAAAGDLAILSLDAILGVDDLPEKTVPVPAWGGSVRLKALSHGQMLDAQKAATGPDGDVDAAEYDMQILALALVEPKVTREQLGQLRQKNHSVLRAVISEAVVLCFSDPEKAAARFPETAGDSVRVPPGAGSGDDGDTPPAGDAG